jgi:putative exosortase-associated protein (TIGR04073 family)
MHSWIRGERARSAADPDGARSSGSPRDIARKDEHVMAIPRRRTTPAADPSRGLRIRMLLPIGVLILALAVPGIASARDSSARKVGRGAANLTLGVLALPGEMVQTTRESGPFVGATWGFAKGVGMFVASEVVGLWEVLTCPFETPPGFKPILRPEFPWGYFVEDQHERRLTRTRPRARTR